MFSGWRAVCVLQYSSRSLRINHIVWAGGSESGYAGDLCDVWPAAVQKTAGHTFADRVCTWEGTKYRECCMNSDA